jgi:hypothetical protein
MILLFFMISPVPETTKLIVFEDNAFFLDEIYRQLEGQEETIEVVASARSLGGAFGVLRQMADKELMADVVLLDGNLSHYSERPVFELATPLSTTDTVKRGLFRRAQQRRIERTTIDSADDEFRQPSGDARAILKVMEVTKLAQKVIGISLDSFASQGLQVDVDLTKGRLNQLAETILSFRHENETKQA